MGCLVVDDIEVAAQWCNNLVADEAVELHLALFDLGLQGGDAVLNLLVRLRLLHQLECQLRCVKTDIDQFVAKLL